MKEYNSAFELIDCKKTSKSAKEKSDIIDAIIDKLNLINISDNDVSFILNLTVDVIDNLKKGFISKFTSPELVKINQSIDNSKAKLNYLAGFRAIERAPRALSLPEQHKKKHEKYKRKVRKMSQKEIADNVKAQTSTIVKMVLDGFTLVQIKEATNVSDNFIFDIKREFGLVRLSQKEQKEKIKSMILNSAPLTYSISSISEKTGINKWAVRRIISSIPQIERGTEAGQMYNLYYNHEIITGDGSTSRGTVY